jgi:hypothetical protein
LRKEWIFMLALLLLFSCDAPRHRDRPQENPGALEKSGLYRYFIRLHAGKTVQVWAFKDVNNDGLDDLILIYRTDREKNAMRVVLPVGETYMITNEVPAPVSNQIITFNDIDGKPPVEFIVQGMKGKDIGYAVYRIENNTLVDLFSEGMEGCCG